MNSSHGNHILFGNRKRKVFEFLKHLLFVRKLSTQILPPDVSVVLLAAVSVPLVCPEVSVPLVSVVLLWSVTLLCAVALVAVCFQNNNNNNN